MISRRLKRSPKQVAVLAVTLLLVILAFIVVGRKIYYGEIFGYERGRFTSPDGHYQIIIWGRGVNLLPSGPGDAGGVPGNAAVFDLKTGKQIGRATLDMAYLATTCSWSLTNVSVVDVGQWELPSAKFNPIW